MVAVIWGITVPFREDPDPTINRHALLTQVLAHLETSFPTVPIELVDSDTEEPFNRAGARNACVRRAEQLGWAVVMILDADTLLPAALVTQAVDAATHGGIHQPFRRCVTIPPELGITPSTLTLEHMNRQTAVRVWVSPGSCYILNPETYWAAGGQDEGFTNWGGEDTAFLTAARTLGIPVIRHPTGPQRLPAASATAIQLHHGDATHRRQHASYPATKNRQAIYERLTRHPDLMRQWITERDTPDAETKWAQITARPQRSQRLRTAVGTPTTSTL